MLIGKIRYSLTIWLKTLLFAMIPPISKHIRLLIDGAFRSFRRKMPIITLDKLLEGIDDDLEFRLKIIETREHNICAFELFCLGAITKKFNPKLALEIGTYDGRSAMAIATNIDGILYTVNLPADYIEKHPEEAHIVDVQLSQKVKSGERILSPENERIVQIYADSKNLDFSKFSGAKLIFIDGAHDYATIKSDTENAIKIIDKNKGIIVWDDTTHFDVGKYLPTLNYPIHIIEGTKLAVLCFSNGRTVNPN